MLLFLINETKSTVPRTCNKTPFYGLQIVACELEDACEFCNPTLSVVKTFSLTRS